MFAEEVQKAAALAELEDLDISRGNLRKSIELGNLATDMLLERLKEDEQKGSGSRSVPDPLLRAAAESPVASGSRPMSENAEPNETPETNAEPDPGSPEEGTGTELTGASPLFLMAACLRCRACVRDASKRGLAREACLTPFCGITPRRFQSRNSLRPRPLNSPRAQPSSATKWTTSSSAAPQNPINARLWQISPCATCRRLRSAAINVPGCWLAWRCCAARLRIIWCRRACAPAARWSFTVAARTGSSCSRFWRSRMCFATRASAAGCLSGTPTNGWLSRM